MARDLALSYVPLLQSGWTAHDECRKQSIDQLNAELARAKAAGEGYNAIYVCMKELELAIHSSAMMQVAATMATLAAFGVPVPVPTDELPTEEDTQQ